MLKIKGPIKLPVGLIDGQVIEFDLYFTKKDRKRYLILKLGDLLRNQPIYLRIESACIFGHVMGSRRCDCGFQLKNALNIIGNDNGLLIYSIDDDGRGLGIEGHFDTYFFRQVKLLETEDLYKKIKRPIDDRNYDIVADILHFFKVKNVKLLTNNNKRILALKDKGFKVSRAALEMRIDEYCAPALMDKKDHLHYLFSFDSHFENFKFHLNNKKNLKHKFSFLVTEDFYKKLGSYFFDDLDSMEDQAIKITCTHKRLVFYFNFFPSLSFIKKLKKIGVLSIILLRDNLSPQQLKSIRSEIGFIELIKINK